MEHEIINHNIVEIDPYDQLVDSTDGLKYKLKDVCTMKGSKKRFLFTEEQKQLFEKHKKNKQREAFYRYIENNRETHNKRMAEVMQKKYREKQAKLIEEGVRKKPLSSFKEDSLNLNYILCCYRKSLILYKKGYIMNQPEIPQILIDNNLVTL